MKSLYAKIVGAVALTTLLSVSAFADTMKPAAKPAAKTAAVSAMKCPACGMMMTTKKSAAAPVAVVYKGKTYYCCAGCAFAKTHAKPAVKTGVKPMVKGAKM